MKKKLLITFFIVFCSILLACSSPTSQTGFTNNSAYNFTYDDFVESFNKYFSSPYSIDRTYTYDGFDVEVYNINGRSLYLELFLDNSAITEICVTFMNEATDDVYELLYGLFKIIDLPHDIDAFDNILYEMQSTNDYTEVLNFDDMWLLFHRYESYKERIHNTISYYPMPPI